ncbi:MAG: phosphate acetyltransferase, partial [Firmicutes bacterium]|nr:phosphate acetyltransferase [Bacillota bacterium]
MDFLNSIKARAKASKKTIVLPESYERRTLDAAHTVLEEGIADVILVGDKAKILEVGAGCNLEKATFIDPANYEKMPEFAKILADLRKSKGVTVEEATQMLQEPLTFGVMLVKEGVADGMVSGAVNSTANVLRPALQILKTAPGSDIVSAFFIMVCPDKEYGENGVFIFADCGLNQNPDSKELAATAISSAKSFSQLVGAEPKVAMLSHSTKGSAAHADVDKVTAAVAFAKEMA